MRVLGFMSLHYAGEFFKESLISVASYVDKFHIAFSRSPSHGHNTILQNPDKEYSLRKIAEDILGDKLIWETYEGFTGEAEHRNMRYNHSIGYSVILTIDPDEIFETRMLSETLDRAYHSPYRFLAVSGYKHFWKGFDWYFEDSDRPIRIENLTADNLLTGICDLTVYHMSLSQSEELIRYKFSCFGHKTEVKVGYLEKYLSWAEDKIDEITHLHPTRDDIWQKPQRYLEELPELLKNHKTPPKPQKMKILLLPMDYNRHWDNPELFTDLLDAFNIEHEAIIPRDLDHAAAFIPDVILFQSSLTWFELVTLREQVKLLTNNQHTPLICMYSGDGLYLPPEGLMKYKDLVDCYLLPFSGKSLEPYQVFLGKPCHFLWESIQRWRFVPNKQMETGPIVFVGNHYGHLPGNEIRKEIPDFIKDHVVETKIYGDGARSQGTIDYNKVPELYNNAFAVICENNYNDREEYFTPRNIGALAAGTCALHRWFPGIEKHFQNYTHGIYYRNKYELLETINFLKANPAIRNHLADHGFKLANEKFTMKNWVNDFMNIIKQYI